MKNKKSDIKGKSSLNILKVVGLGIVAIILFLAFGGLIKLLWNNIMPNLFGLNKISYLQGFGLLLLSRILIGGFESDKKTYRTCDGN